MQRAPGMPPRHVTARVAPLSSRLVLALVEDRTRERRVESIRRDFVANVSHELKTPVGAIRLLSDAVIDAADDPEAVQRFAGADAHRERAAGPAGAADHRALPAPGRRPARRAGRRVASTRSSTARSTRTSPTPTPGTSRWCRRREGPGAAGQQGAGRGRRGQPGRQRGGLLPGGLDGRGRRARRGRHHRRHHRDRPGDRHPRRPRSTGSSSGSTGSTRLGTAPPAAPGSGCRSSSTSRRRTAATSGCGPSRGRARRSRLTLPRKAHPTRHGGSRDPRAGGRGRGELQRRARPTCSARRASRWRSRPPAPEALSGVRPGRRRHRAARPDAPGHPGHGGVPADPADLQRPGDHGQREGRRGRQGRRPRARGRRLRHQAVLPARAGRPDPRGAPPRHRAGPRPDDARGRPGADGRRAARGHHRRRGRPAAAQGVRAARDVPAQPRPGADPRAS